MAARYEVLGIGGHEKLAEYMFTKLKGIMGTSNLEVIELTQAQYDALPAADRNDPNKIFFIVDNVQYLTTNDIQFDTTAGWASKSSLVSEENHIYVYTDHQTLDGMDIPGFKVGDGNAYVVDLPFSDAVYKRHLENSAIHVSAEDRLKWDNKVSCRLDPDHPDILVFEND